MSRQNINDIEYELLQKESKTNLRYGLTININLKSFNLKNIRAFKDDIDTQISFDKEVVIENLSDALKKKSMKKYFLINKKKNHFDKFHEANIKKGVVIRIPKNRTIKNPIRIEHKLLSKNSLQHIIIIAEENSEITIVDTIDDRTKTKGYHSKFVEVIAKKNSSINYVHIQKINKKKVHYSKKTGLAETNAKINWYDFFIGSKITISRTSTILKGESSNSKLQSIFFSDGEQQFDILGEGIHRAEKTISKLIAKGATKNKSKILYKGNIHIEKKATNSNGLQIANLIMIDKESEADAIPQLLIDNNAVKCSHAVAIGRIDEEKLFYLMSRGISEKEAKNQILKGFFESTIKDIKIKSVSDYLRAEIDYKMR